MHHTNLGRCHSRHSPLEFRHQRRPIPRVHRRQDRHPPPHQLRPNRPQKLNEELEVVVWKEHDPRPRARPRARRQASRPARRRPQRRPARSSRRLRRVVRAGLSGSFGHEASAALPADGCSLLAPPPQSGLASPSSAQTAPNARSATSAPPPSPPAPSRDPAPAPPATLKPAHPAAASARAQRAASRCSPTAPCTAPPRTQPKASAPTDTAEPTRGSPPSTRPHGETTAQQQPDGDDRAAVWVRRSRKQSTRP